jgi:CelD/BcsL family acetyltransferase involved in cellulose biosynthesis
VLTIHIARDRQALQAIAADWEALVGESYTATFSRPPWHLAWLEAYPPLGIALVSARSDGRLVGVLPLALVRSDVRGLYLPLVTSIARGDYQPPIVDPAMAAEVLPAMLDTAMEHFGSRSVYVFPNIPAKEPTLEILLSWLRSRGMAYAMTTDIAPRIRIGGRSYAQLEGTWSARHRREVRYKRRRLETLGDVRLWQPRTLEEALEAMQDFFAIHDEKWLSQGHPARFHDASSRRYFLAVARHLWNRGLHLSALRCGTANVYYSVSFISGGWVLLYKPASRIEYHKYSPGTVFISLLLEHACRSAWEGIDFLLGTEEFKSHWSNEALPVVSLCAASRARSLAFQWFTRGRPYLLEHVQPAMARVKARLQRSAMHLMLPRAESRAPVPMGVDQLPEPPRGSSNEPPPSAF